MGKAGGIIGILAGIFGVIAAVVTLFVGGVGSAFQAESAKTVVGLGWGGVVFSFLAIVFGAIAFARPRGAGIGLIIVSIAGAILGGTLVAVCMVLSLIGGILAVIGGKKTPVNASPETAGAPTKKSSAWLWVGGSVTALVVAVVAIGSLAPSRPKSDPIADLAAAQASRLQAEGELSELFALGSKNTNLQRENKLREIKGQVVEWTLPVYEVHRSGDGYKIQTKTKVRVGSFGTDLIGTFIRITPRSDEEMRQIEALKTDDLVTFKGRIEGATLRKLDIKPAILAARGTAIPATASAKQAVQQPDASADIISSIRRTGGYEAAESDLKGKGWEQIGPSTGASIFAKEQAKVFIEYFPTGAGKLKSITSTLRNDPMLQTLHKFGGYEAVQAELEKAGWEEKEMGVSVFAKAKSKIVIEYFPTGAGGIKSVEELF